MLEEVWKKVVHSCPTLCNPMDYTVHGILQARIPEWVTFPISRRSSHPMDRTQVSHIAGVFFTSWATREANVEKKKSSYTAGGNVDWYSHYKWQYGGSLKN